MSQENNDTPKDKSKSNFDPAKLELRKLLKRRRKELGLSLSDIERETHIRRKYLKYIESGDYSSLPEDVYSKGYVKNYAEHLGFDTREILKLYSLERMYHSKKNSDPGSEKVQSPSLKPINSRSYTITPKSIVLLIASIFVLTLVSYVGWQFSQLSAPPRINLAIQDRTSVDTGFVIVSGEVDSGSDVFINGTPILSSTDGSFSERVTLASGANQISISARNRFGRESSKTIVVESKSQLANSVDQEISKSTLNGVEVLVSISPSASYLNVKLDGKEVYKGTMLPGTKQLFKAKDSISISTSNAGSTSLTVSNQLVGNKDVGVLGFDGESKKDIIFNKDTSIK